MAKNHPVVIADDIPVLTINIMGLEWVFPGQNMGPKPGFRYKLP